MGYVSGSPTTRPDGQNTRVVCFYSLVYEIVGLTNSRREQTCLKARNAVLTRPPPHSVVSTCCTMRTTRSYRGLRENKFFNKKKNNVKHNIITYTVRWVARDFTKQLSEPQTVEYIKYNIYYIKLQSRDGIIYDSS